MERDVRCQYTRAVLDALEDGGRPLTPERLRGMDPELASLSDPAAYLQDPIHWVPVRVADQLLSFAAKQLEDPLAPRRVAGFAVQRSRLGYRQRLILDTFGSTEEALRHLGEIPFLHDRTRRTEAVRVDRGFAVIRVHWTPWLNPGRGLCLFCQGLFAHLPRYWDEATTAFAESACRFNGDGFCEYEMHWRPKSRLRLWWGARSGRGRLLQRIHREMEEERARRQRRITEAPSLNRALQLKIRQLVAVHETGNAILSVLELEDLLSDIMRILARVCRIRRAAILMVDEKKRALESLFDFGFDPASCGDGPDRRIPLARNEHLLVKVAAAAHSVYVPASERPLFPKSRSAPSPHCASQFAVPLQTRHRVTGVLAAEADGPDGIPEETRETLEIFAPQIAIAIRNATLYRRQQRQMAELKESRDLLCRAEKLSFLGHISARLAHEIKNPLTAIGTFLQMLPARFDDPEFREGFHAIAVEETERINRLIGELLGLAKPVESVYEPTDLPDLMERMILLVSPRSHGKRIQVQRRFNSGVGTVRTDPEKLKQVVLNVLTNAVEFSPDQGEITVTLSRRRHSSGRSEICIEIADQGPGVTGRDAERIFDPYFTTKGSSRASGGTGLGLFIAAKNLEDLGGSIGLASGKPGVGAVFRIRFPEASPPERRQGRGMLPVHPDRRISPAP